MRRLWILVLPLILALPGAVEANDGKDARVKALEVLKVRMEAKQREAELLEAAGRTDEAIAAFREIGTIYDRELDRIAKLFPAGRLVVRAPKIRRPVMQPPATLPVPAATAPRPNPAAVAQAVDRALAWLVSHQSPHGGWEAANFTNYCDGKPRGAEDLAQRPDGQGKALYDVGITGLVLNALLTAGVKPTDQTVNGTAVAKGLRYLKNVQDPEGCFGPRSTQQYIYNHATAALAMVKAHVAVAPDTTWKRPAQRALDFSAMARNPYFGWRYGIKPGDNDTSVTTWMLSAFHVAKAAKLTDAAARLVFDDSAFDGALAWLEKVTDDKYGKVGYLQRGAGSARPQEMLDRFPAERSEAMTSAGILMRSWIGKTTNQAPVVKRGTHLVLKTLPVWNTTSGEIDMYAWLTGTLAMQTVGGKAWTLWRNAACEALVKNQRGDTKPCDYLGSWDPIGPWGPDGGRVYSTAVCATVLAVCKQGL